MSGGGFADLDAAQKAFYQAFRELDLPLMEQVWSEDPETVCIHPGGGLLSGKQAVLQSWSTIFAAARKPLIEFQTLRVTRSGDLAVHLVEETIHPGGASQAASRVLATNIFLHDTSGWHLLAHHASLPLVATSTASADPAPTHLH
jgi:ketosteroid isomerase-like protein